MDIFRIYLYTCILKAWFKISYLDKNYKHKKYLVLSCLTTADWFSRPNKVYLVWLRKDKLGPVSHRLSTTGLYGKEDILSFHKYFRVCDCRCVKLSIPNERLTSRCSSTAILRVTHIGSCNTDSHSTDFSDSSLQTGTSLVKSLYEYLWERGHFIAHNHGFLKMEWTQNPRLANMCGFCKEVISLVVFMFYFWAELA